MAAAVVVGALAVMPVTPAMAAQPNHRACLGEDIRGYAQGGAEASGFRNLGGMVSVLAEDGVGMEIQAHLAGDIPDAVIPNSCND